VDPTSFTTQDGSALIAGVDAGTSSDSTAAAADTLTTPSSGTISQYKVKAGDTLSSIAQNFSVSVNTILWANNITDKSTIKAGTVLVILPVSGIEHTVRSGETLSSLAKKFGADATDIAQFNGLDSSAGLVAGSTIIIPGGELSSSSTARSTQAAKKPVITVSSGSTKTTTISVSTKTSSAHSSLAINYSDATNNPYKGGSGSALSGFFSNPVPGALLTQGIHGWNGVDLGAHIGTPIYAAAKGTVILARTGGWNGGYGNYVIIDNGNGIETLYAHMSSIQVSVGDDVSRGAQIGAVGMTGEATGAHLHFEVRGAQNPFAHCTEMTVCQPE
jgi:murein DD-endopeptidase MepM/ murein hydrolase activator NlpD